MFWSHTTVPSHRQLKVAVADEDYALAAKLRDEQKVGVVLEGGVSRNGNGGSVAGGLSSVGMPVPTALVCTFCFER